MLHHFFRISLAALDANTQKAFDRYPFIGRELIFNLVWSKKKFWKGRCQPTSEASSSHVLKSFEVLKVCNSFNNNTSSRIGSASLKFFFSGQVRLTNENLTGGWLLRSWYLISLKPQSFQRYNICGVSIGILFLSLSLSWVKIFTNAFGQARGGDPPSPLQST